MKIKYKSISNSIPKEAVVFLAESGFLSGGQEFMDIKELDELIKNHQEYASSKRNLFESFRAFLKFFITYANDELKDKTYSFDHIVPQIFSFKVKDEKQYLRYTLYVAREYANYIYNSINEGDIDFYNDLITETMCDFEYLIAQYELNLKNGKLCSLHTGERTNMDSFDIRQGASDLFHLSLCNNIKHISTRNLQSSLIFFIRQCLEKAGRSFIGYNSLNDKNGNPIHQFTQISWTFLYNIKDKGLIQLPFQVASIKAINDWTNGYVHNPKVYCSYMRYYALLFIQELFKPIKAPIQTFCGPKGPSLEFGDFQIKDFNALKYEFEHYVTKIYGRPLSIDWMPPDQIGAYILNMGEPKVFSWEVLKKELRQEKWRNNMKKLKKWIKRKLLFKRCDKD